MGKIVFSRPDNECLMGDITDQHFGSKAKAKKKKKHLRQENVFVVWVLNISLKMPCSPLLADKPHGRINVMKTILCQKKKCCYHDNSHKHSRSHGLLLQWGYIHHFVYYHCCVDKKRVKHHIIPRIIRNMSMVKHWNSPVSN